MVSTEQVVTSRVDAGAEKMRIAFPDFCEEHTSQRIHSPSGLV